MARKYRTTVREEKAVEFTVSIAGIQEYKDAWLAICNNAREYPTDIYKVNNSSWNSNIYVFCNPKSADKAKLWLEQFGEVTNIDEDKYAVFVDVSCEYTGNFDDDYIDSEYIFGELD